MMNDKERVELFKMNLFILENKILPLVKDKDLRTKIVYCFKVDNIDFYLAWMPVWAIYEQWKDEVKTELKRIYNEYGIEYWDGIALLPEDSNDS